jgi:hypothetical protein
MKNTFLCAVLLLAHSLSANNDFTPSDGLTLHPLIVAMEEMADPYIFSLIQLNVDNLKNRDASNESASELMNLIEEGYKIDPLNMSKLIETLTHRDASDNAMLVIIKSIEHDSTITTDHMSFLIQTLGQVNASDNATAVILSAIAHGVDFGPKERFLLTAMNKMVNAKQSVESIRKALHERQANLLMMPMQ